MTGKLLTEKHFEFLSLKGGCIGSPESTLVKMPNCWKSHVAARITQLFYCSSSLKFLACFLLSLLKFAFHVLDFYVELF